MSRVLRVVSAAVVCLPALHLAKATPQAPSAARKATTTGELLGTVSDPTGARIPGATIHLVSKGETRDVVTDSLGRYSARLPPGTYALTVNAEGFVSLHRESLRVAAGAHTEVPLTLSLNTEMTEVNVNANDVDRNSASANQTAITLSGATLATLSDDETTFQQQIQAMAGGGDSDSTQLIVDGFSGARFPPKNAIREIRINGNPFSAQYDSIGFGRIEVFTKPGADKLHGNLSVGGNDQSFNARNPFTGAQPPYHNLYFDGNVNGPIGTKTSFFASGSRTDQQNNAVVNAVTDAGPVSEAVPNPQISDTVSARLDRQVTANNVVTGRYEWSNSSQQNSGVGVLVLPSEGLTTSTTVQTLQLSDTQSLGASTVVETRFEYLRTRLQQTPNSTAPTVIVQGSFSGGGNPAQAVTDNQDHYELQEYLSRVFGPHLLRTGGRLRANREANRSLGGYNGAFTFQSLTAYETARNSPSQFNVTTGDSAAEVSTVDWDIYAEDEWKLRKDLTLNTGFRFESQTAVPDHTDPAPRLGLAYSVPSRHGKDPFAVVRTGFGIFYDRFAVANLLTAVRQNGISQLAFYAENPGFYCTDASCIGSQLAALPSVEPTIYQVAPNLHTEYSMVSSLSAEHSFGDKGTVSATYLGARGVHQYLSRNINAPLPGTYDPTDLNSGTRPLGGTQNIYQFSSDGIRHANILLASADLNPTKRLSVWAFFSKQNRNGDTSGATSFPTNQYDLAQDFGRSAVTKQRLFAGVWYNAPKGFMGGLFLRSLGGTPYNITTGTDLNGDTQFNDRPAFATDLTRASVVRTPLGNFDTAPMAGQTLVPINYATSPALAMLNLNVAKEVRFGPRPAAVAGAPQGGAAKPEPRYQLRFSVEAQNLTNHTNAGVPVGVLPTPGEALCSSIAASGNCSYFGKSLSLADNYSGITAANRTVTLHTDFSF